MYLSMEPLNCKGEDEFDVAVNGPFDSAIKGSPKGKPEGARKVHDLHKDAEEGAFEFALTGAIEVALELHM